MSDTLKQSTDSALIAADKVQGTAVFNRTGERLGTIKDIYIDKRSGKAEYASMAAGGVLGVGAKYHPVPWSFLDYDTDKDGFVVDLDKDALEATPAYEEDALYAENTPWRGEVTDYFGARGV
jgi:uncharacterized protein YrrD